jgi:hypothetical protein
MPWKTGSDCKEQVSKNANINANFGIMKMVMISLRFMVMSLYKKLKGKESL